MSFGNDCCGGDCCHEPCEDCGIAHCAQADSCPGPLIDEHTEEQD
jgi:hypothetical protein